MKFQELDEVEGPMIATLIDPNGSLDLRNMNLKTLKGCPKYLNGDFQCQFNDLTSLEFVPRVIDGHFNCTDNYIESLHNIHKHMDFVGGYFSFGKQKTNKLPTHILGLCLIKGIEAIRCTEVVNDLFDQYRHDVVMFQHALIEAGFPEQAKL